MTQIGLVTIINAPIERCLDLARSIDFHVASTTYTREKAVAGKVTGLVELGDEVTFQARHLGFTQKLTSKITGYERPFKFTDTMLKGAFKSLSHVHRFKYENGLTYMYDTFQYEVPAGLLGTIADKLVLEKYMRKFLQQRNNELKKALESEEWKTYLINTV